MKLKIIKKIFTLLMILPIIPVAGGFETYAFVPEETTVSFSIEPVAENINTVILRDEDVTFEVGVYIQTPEVVSALEFAVLPSDTSIGMSLIEDSPYLVGNAFPKQNEKYGSLYPRYRKNANGEDVYVMGGYLIPDNAKATGTAKTDYLAHFNITIPKELPSGTYSLEFEHYIGNTYTTYDDGESLRYYQLSLEPFQFEVRKAPSLADVVSVCKIIRGDMPQNLDYDLDGNSYVDGADLTLVKRRYIKYSQ